MALLALLIAIWLSFIAWQRRIQQLPGWKPIAWMAGAGVMLGVSLLFLDLESQKMASRLITPLGIAWVGLLALALAQLEFGRIERNRTARVTSKKEGVAPYTYDWADLETVLAAVRPALAKHDIAILQFPTAWQGAVTVLTVLAHGASGQWIKNALTVACPSV